MTSRGVSESAHDFGSTCLVAHTLPSSCKESWNTRLAYTEVPTRIYAGVEVRVQGDGLQTHTIKVLDEPHQILTLQIWNHVSVLIPAEDVDEVLAELWRGSIELAELL